MNNDMKSDGALQKKNQDINDPKRKMLGNSPQDSIYYKDQSKLPEKSSARQSQSTSEQPIESQAKITAERPHPPRYPNTKLPGITRAQTQVIMDTYGVHPITDEHNEMFNYKNIHKERHGY